MYKNAIIVHILEIVRIKIVSSTNPTVIRVEEKIKLQFYYPLNDIMQ